MNGKSGRICKSKKRGLILVFVLFAVEIRVLEINRKSERITNDD